MQGVTPTQRSPEQTIRDTFLPEPGESPKSTILMFSGQGGGHQNPLGFIRFKTWSLTTEEKRRK
jgi:hypothetical protein